MRKLLHNNAAVRPFQKPFLLDLGQVAPDRRFMNAEFLG